MDCVWLLEGHAILGGRGWADGGMPHGWQGLGHRLRNSKDGDGLELAGQREHKEGVGHEGMMAMLCRLKTSRDSSGLGLVHQPVAHSRKEVGGLGDVDKYRHPGQAKRAK